MNAWDRFLLVIFVVAAVAAVGMFIAALQDVFEPKPEPVVVPVEVESDALADCDSCTVHLIVGGACLHCGWAAL